MIRSMLRLLRDPLTQDIALKNAQQAACRLAHQRRQREAVDDFIAQTSGSRKEAGRLRRPPAVARRRDR